MHRQMHFPSRPRRFNRHRANRINLAIEIWRMKRSGSPWWLATEWKIGTSLPPWTRKLLPLHRRRRTRYLLPDVKIKSLRHIFLNGQWRTIDFFFTGSCIVQYVGKFNRKWSNLQNCAKEERQILSFFLNLINVFFIIEKTVNFFLIRWSKINMIYFVEFSGGKINHSRTLLAHQIELVPFEFGNIKANRTIA